MNKKTEDAEKTLSQAFTDINALMQKAKDLVCRSNKTRETSLRGRIVTLWYKVVLADKFAAIQKAEEKAGSEGDAPEDQEFRNFLVSMGITSPVTKYDGITVSFQNSELIC